MMGKRYDDTGCRVSSKCTECPLDICLLDKLPIHGASFKLSDDDALKAREQLAAGVDIRRVAKSLGVTPTTVRRAIKRIRKDM